MAFGDDDPPDFDSIRTPFLDMIDWANQSHVQLYLQAEEGNPVIFNNTMDEAIEKADAERQEWIDDLNSMFRRTKINYYGARLQDSLLCVDQIMEYLDEGRLPPCETLQMLYNQQRIVLSDVQIVYKYDMPDEIQKLKDKWVPRGVDEIIFESFFLNPVKYYTYITDMFFFAADSLKVLNLLIASYEKLAESAENMERLRYVIGTYSFIAFTILDHFSDRTKDIQYKLYDIFRPKIE